MTSGRRPTAAPGDPERIYLGLGSNLGDRRSNLDRAMEALAEEGIGITGRSSLYRTGPVGYNEQPEFLNAVVEVAAHRPPEALLRLLRDIEDRMGRRRDVPRWGPRVIDLDILLFGRRVISSATLTIPHPEMHRRRFVLAPLAEVAPDAEHPVLGRTARELLDGLDDEAEVTRIGDWQGSP